MITSDVASSTSPVNELSYIESLSGHLKYHNIPYHAIVDTSRNGFPNVTLNTYSVPCDPMSLGFGEPFTWQTEYDEIDALMWIGNGGFSDGPASISIPRLENQCVGAAAEDGLPIRVTPRWTWDRAHFVGLLKNADPPISEEEPVDRW
jgi:cellulase/cellobiase CelA1